tara:strand:- start:10619 stop:11116 length:498 start_codon:yes stop_codon:yes gene_type:complete
MAVTLIANLELMGMKAVIGAYAAAGEDLTPLMDMCGALLEASTKDRIRDTNQSPDGVPWSPSFRSVFDGGKILSDSGRLGDSITHIAGPNSVEVGTNVIYAGIHQTGGIIQAKAGYALAFAFPGGGFAVVEDVSIPARPYLGISTEDRGDLTAAVVTYFDSKVAQ